MNEQVMPFKIFFAKSDHPLLESSSTLYTKDGHPVFSMTCEPDLLTRNREEFTSACYIEIISIQTMADAEKYTEEHPFIRYAYHGQPYASLQEYETIHHYHQAMVDDIAFFADVRSFIEHQKEYLMLLKAVQNDRSNNDNQSKMEIERKHLVAFYRKYFSRFNTVSSRTSFSDMIDEQYESEFFGLLPLVDKLRIIEQKETSAGIQGQSTLFEERGSPGKPSLAETLLENCDLQAYIWNRKRNKSDNEGEQLQERIMSANNDEEKQDIIDDFFSDKEELREQYSQIVMAQVDKTIDSFIMRDVGRYLQKVCAEATIYYDPVNSCIVYFCKDLRTAMYMMAYVASFNEEEYQVCNHPKCHTYFKVDKRHPQTMCDKHMEARRKKRANARAKERSGSSGEK